MPLGGKRARGNSRRHLGHDIHAGISRIKAHRSKRDLHRAASIKLASVQTKRRRLGIYAGAFGRNVAAMADIVIAQAMRHGHDPREAMVALEKALKTARAQEALHRYIATVELKGAVDAARKADTQDYHRKRLRTSLSVTAARRTPKSKVRGAGRKILNPNDFPD